MRKKKPRAIDLFCGCGGLTLGLKQAGFQVVGAVEIDRLAVETYQANHPEVEVWEEDIQGLTVARVKRKLTLKKGELDLLAGCPPCQGFSTMTTLNGGYEICDERNDLISQFMKFVEGLAPKTIMMENVPGLAKDKRFRTFCRKLKNLGYVINHAILDAADYGVPQRRKRLILLAGKGKRIEFAKKAARRTVADAISRMGPAGESGDALHDLPERRTAKVKKLIRMIPKNGGSRKDLGKRWQLECHKKCDGFKDVYGRMAWDKVAPTITSGCTNPSKGRFLHPVENRAITLREAALLQTFPEDYYFPHKKGKGKNALMIGNALPVSFIKTHATSVSNFLCSKRES
ncbi:MAG: DNA (cytosine-5-)-methyltransferase [Planctomycetes bacterium B3_Pla]|nr:MAG: DNA (cytosine-5-)-methyltransferase [Planctomycetes bacterium B3_Pla]